MATITIALFSLLRYQRQHAFCCSYKPWAENGQDLQSFCMWTSSVCEAQWYKHWDLLYSPNPPFWILLGHSDRNPKMLQNCSVNNKVLALTLPSGPLCASDVDHFAVIILCKRLMTSCRNWLEVEWGPAPTSAIRARVDPKVDLVSITGNLSGLFPLGLKTQESTLPSIWGLGTPDHLKLIWATHLWPPWRFTLGLGTLQTQDPHCHPRVPSRRRSAILTMQQESLEHHWDTEWLQTYLLISLTEDLLCARLCSRHCVYTVNKNNPSPCEASY